MKPGEFKKVTKGGNIIGFIFLRDDNTFEAIKAGYKNKSIKIDAFDTEKEAHKLITK